MNTIRSILWTLVWPLRVYVKHFPFPRGKGLIVEYMLKPILPQPPQTFRAILPGGGMVDLLFREKIGFSTLLKGPFERAELEYIGMELDPGDVALDVGANIGIYSVAMGRAVGEEGRVLAFEPFPENIERLRSNLAINQLSAVQIFELALTDHEGEVNLYLSGDSAYPSTVQVKEGMANGRQLVVKTTCLDTVWKEAGNPRVKIIKIDVEGAEVDVLKGGAECIAACHGGEEHAAPGVAGAHRRCHHRCPGPPGGVSGN